MGKKKEVTRVDPKTFREVCKLSRKYIRERLEKEERS